MAVTRPQTRAGVVDLFATDLADAIAYAKEKHAAARMPSPARSTAGWPAASTRRPSDFIVAVMDDMLDKQQALPPA